MTRLHLAQRPRIASQLRIGGDQGQSFGEGLCQQQAIEGLFMQGGKRSMLTAGW
jgi:hypothetical protein